MASRLGQYLVIAKSKAEKFELFALYYLLFGCHMANFWLLLRKQCYSPNVNHCTWAIGSWPSAVLGGVGSLHLTECPVSFNHNAITAQIAENTLPRLKPSFSKMWNYTKYPKQV